ncbi:MAG: sugar ABC transporter permease [Chloroflexi bacterium]|nr:sugar ABC transporter permease [Chloroflexota bacterium]
MQSSLSGKRQWKDAWVALLFLLPSLVLFAVFSFYPMVSAIRLSFFKWDNLAFPPVFNGITNYIQLFHNDRFWNSLRVTFEYMLGVTSTSIGFGLILAVFLNNRYLVWKSLWRVLFFLPTVSPTIAAAMVWILLFNPTFGYVNTLFRQIGIQGPNWLSSTAWALPTVMSLGIWRRVGFTVIVYLAALQAIPNEYYESAQVDGASSWRSFLHITVPLVVPTTLMLITLGLIDSFLVFDQVLVMTRGGPAGATEVIGQFLYSDAFTLFKMGTGSAIAVVTLVIIASLTLLQWRTVGFGRSVE